MLLLVCEWSNYERGIAYEKGVHVPDRIKSNEVTLEFSVCGGKFN